MGDVEPLSWAEREKYLASLPQTLREPKSWQMRYEATVKAVEAERDALRHEVEIQGEAIMLVRVHLKEFDRPFVDDVAHAAAAEIKRLRARLKCAEKAIGDALAEFDSPGDDRDPVVVILKAAA